MYPHLPSDMGQVYNQPLIQSQTFTPRKYAASSHEDV